MRKFALLSVVAALCLSFSFVSRAADEKKEVKLTCPVSGEAADASHSVAYKGGKVAFCCDNCPKEFAKNTAKYATKANAQLVSTGQAKQAMCPITGKATKAGTEVAVAGAKVAFCCNNCKGKVEKAEGDAKLELVYSDKAFKNGFKVAKEKNKKDKDS